MDGIHKIGAGYSAPWQRMDGDRRTDSPAARQEQAAVSQPEPPEERQPTIFEMMQEAKEKAEAQRKRLQLPKNSARYGDATMEAYARLSRARTHAEVNAAAGYARRRIIQFKAAKRQDGENAERIQAAINQLQKAVNRASKKKRDLDREKLADSRRARLEKEKRLREAQRQKLELRRSRSMRMIRESGYLREAEIDNRLQAHMAETRLELRAQAQALSAGLGPSLDSQQYAAQAAPTPAPTPEISLQA